MLFYISFSLEIFNSPQTNKYIYPCIFFCGLCEEPMGFKPKMEKWEKDKVSLVFPVGDWRF